MMTDMKWYVVHVFAGYEFRIKEIIEKGIKKKSFENDLGEILIPTQATFHIRGGKKVERERKIFSNYIIIEANLTAEVYNYIVRVDGVTKFLGSGKTPLPLSPKEVSTLLGQDNEEIKDTRVIKSNLILGDMVRIISGAFVEFSGEVKSLSQKDGKVVVDVTVFGRITSVELQIDQVEKIR